MARRNELHLLQTGTRIARRAFGLRLDSAQLFPVGEEKDERGLLLEIAVLLTAEQESSLDVSETVDGGGILWQRQASILQDHPDGPKLEKRVLNAAEVLCRAGVLELKEGVFSPRKASPEHPVNRTHGLRLQDRDAYGIATPASFLVLVDCHTCGQIWYPPSDAPYELEDQGERGGPTAGGVADLVLGCACHNPGCPPRSP